MSARKERLKKKYSNGEITVFWDPSLCIHDTTCFTELPEVFRPYDRPWINMEGASTHRIVEVVKKCPTEAITVKFNAEIMENSEPLADDKEIKEPETPVEIRVKYGGPYIVKGNFTVIDSEGNPLKKRDHMALCRCGASKDMPYCDGEHSFVHFE